MNTPSVELPTPTTRRSDTDDGRRFSPLAGTVSPSVRTRNVTDLRGKSLMKPPAVFSDRSRDVLPGL